MLVVRVVPAPQREQKGSGRRAQRLATLPPMTTNDADTLTAAPDLVQIAGGWLAVTPPSAHFRIGVRGTSPDQARSRYAQRRDWWQRFRSELTDDAGGASPSP